VDVVLLAYMLAENCIEDVLLLKGSEEVV